MMMNKMMINLPIKMQQTRTMMGMNDEHGYRWERDQSFDPMTINIDFDNCNTGLRYSPVTFNTPICTYWQIFTTSLLNMIVGYTNEYGIEHCKKMAAY